LDFVVGPELPVLPVAPVVPEFLLVDGPPPPALVLALQLTLGPPDVPAVPDVLGVVEGGVFVHVPGAGDGGRGTPEVEPACPNGNFVPIWLTGTKGSEVVPEAFVTWAEVASVGPGHQATNHPSATVATTS
jgi:hypothetical protein